MKLSLKYFFRALKITIQRLNPHGVEDSDANDDLVAEREELDGVMKVVKSIGLIISFQF